jgi:hypothetical protein
MAIRASYIGRKPPADRPQNLRSPRKESISEVTSEILALRTPPKLEFGGTRGRHESAIPPLQRGGFCSIFL